MNNNTTNTVFRVALVGCGAICPNHLNALKNNPATEIVALCDLRPERAQAAGDRYAPNAALYTDFETMLDREKPDSVHICTPHYLHCPMAVYALEHGVNVFLEKPMAMTTEELDRILQAERRSAARLTVCFQNRFNPSTSLAKQIADEDGGVLSAYGTIFWERDEKYYTESGWRGKFATEGGGVMINQAIHTVDLLCFFLGDPKKVCATVANHHLKGVIEVEDCCEGVITFADDRQANFYMTTAFRGANDTQVYLRTKNHTILIRPPFVYVDGDLVERGEPTPHYIGKECYGNGHLSLIGQFYDALATGAPMPVTATSARRAVDILLAAYRSHDTDVSIPTI